MRRSSEPILDRGRIGYSGACGIVSGGRLRRESAPALTVVPLSVRSILSVSGAGVCVLRLACATDAQEENGLV